MKTLIEIHALQHFASSNLNRDDTGAPKDAWFGGTRRARISSQCLKRAVRSYFSEKHEGGGLFNPDELAVRTKRVYQAIADLLNDKRAKDETLAKAKTALAYVGLGASEKEGEKTEYLLFLGRKEIAALADTINQFWDQIVPAAEHTEEETSKKGKKGKKEKKAAARKGPSEVRDRLASIFNGGKAVDVALFGRMLADMPEKNQYAACQVAHAISTHAVEREFDFYTAVDDLKPEDTAGADMIGTVEFNSACFYRYAVIDWGKLKENLQGDVELSKKCLSAFLEGFVLAEPTGKQNTFAAHNPSEFVVVSVRRNTAPRNLANAFETALRVGKDESFTRKSAERLVEKAKKLNAVYGGDGQTFVLNLTETNLDGFGTSIGTLNELLEKSLHAVKE